MIFYVFADDKTVVADIHQTKLNKMNENTTKIDTLWPNMRMAGKNM